MKINSVKKKSRKKYLLFFLFFAVFLITISLSLITATSGIPKLINLQGRLTDANNVPLYGNFRMVFRIYDASSGGVKLWEEIHEGINNITTSKQGIFNVLLGSITPITLRFDKDYWLEIQVKDEILLPRQRIASVGYAFIADGINGTENVFFGSGNVGIGTKAPLRRLSIVDDGVGLDRPATNVLGFYTANVERMRITPDGFVGIGTPAPATRLHILATAVGQGIWVLGDGMSPQLVFGDTSATYMTIQWMSGVTPYGLLQSYIGGTASGNLALQTGGGNVGIGTAIPMARLEIDGGVRLNTITAKPACTVAQRGTLWFTQGASGVKDTLEVCAKDAGNAYAWRLIW